MADRGSLFGTREIVYMEKLAVGESVKGKINLDAPVAENVHSVAQTKGMDVDDLTVIVLARPRHAELIRQIRETGARIRLIPHGDVAGAILAMVSPLSHADLTLLAFWSNFPQSITAAEVAVLTLKSVLMGAGLAVIAYAGGAGPKRSPARGRRPSRPRPRRCPCGSRSRRRLSCRAARCR